MISGTYQSKIFQVGCEILQGIGKTIWFKSVTLSREHACLDIRIQAIKYDSGKKVTSGIILLIETHYSTTL